VADRARTIVVSRGGLGIIGVMETSSGGSCAAIIVSRGGFGINGVMDERGKFQR